MNDLERRWTDVLIGGALALVAFVAYMLTLSPGAFPGESAALIVQYAGLFPKLTPDHPLWGGAVWLLSHGPADHLALRLNWLSALCGAGSVYLLYRIMVGAIYGTITVTPVNRDRALVAARLAGISAALFLAFSVPFWVVSNRAHPATFDLLLLLVAVWLFYVYATRGRNACLYWLAFLYGLGIVEFPTFIVLAPLFALGLLYLLTRDEEFHAAPVVKAALCGVAGLGLYFVDAWIFYGSSGYELRGYTGYFHVIGVMWREQALLIGRSLPQSGWLIILMTAIVPWLTCLMVAKRALNEEKDWTYYILHVVMTGLAIGILLNMKLAPWPLLGMGRLLVTPYLLTASVFGYLVAYWFLLPGAWWQEVDVPAAQAWLRKRLGATLIVPGLFLLCIAPFRNIEQSDARGGGLINQYAREVIGSLSGRTWLVTDGSMDDQLLVAAKEAESPVKVLNFRGGNNDLYIRYVATLFDNARLKNLARIGMLPLLREWISTDADIESRLAVVSTPDLWTCGGYTPVPNKLVFLGSKDVSLINGSQLLAEHEVFWNRAVPLLAGSAKVKGPLAPWSDFPRRHMSLVANNLGVFLEDKDDAKDAFVAYSKARELVPDNISALLNQANMIDKGFQTEKAAAIKKALADLTSGLDLKYQIWSLSQYYGYVRMPEAFAQLGWTWALSGQPGMAISELKKALELVADDRKNAVKQALASVYLSQKDEESEALYNELLMEDPGNKNALLGMGRVMSQKKDYSRSRKFLDQAEAAGVPKELIDLERASILLAEGQLDKASAVVRELTARKPELAQAWAMLADILLRQGDVLGLEKCVESMQEIKSNRLDPVRAMAQGLLFLMKNDFRQARERFEKSSALMPGNLKLLEVLLRLDVIQSRKDDAIRHVQAILRQNPEHAFANYVMGSLQINNGEYSLAEDSLRKSLEGRRSPETCNDLAWLLQMRGANDEAEKMARSALQMNGKMHQAWDTLGVILMKTKRLAEAEKAFDTALSLYRDDIGVLAHMAELQAMKGDRKRAVGFADQALQRPDLLAPVDRKKMQTIRSGGEK